MPSSNVKDDRIVLLAKNVAYHKKYRETSGLILARKLEPNTSGMRIIFASKLEEWCHRLELNNSDEFICTYEYKIKFSGHSISRKTSANSTEKC